MLCSDCNKNNAEIFINKIENGVSSMEGLCKECAKKRGIDVPNIPNENNHKKDNQKNNKESILFHLFINQLLMLTLLRVCKKFCVNGNFPR